MALELELKKVGFSDKEARVYLALLELGSAPVQEIAKKAKVNRATTYVVLEALSRQGAVSTLEQGKKVSYAAENPLTLLRKFKSEERELRAKEEEFKRALPELEAMFNASGERPKVRFFEGKAAVVALREDILQSGATELLDIYPLEKAQEIQSLFSPEENADFLKRRQERGVTIRAIYTSESAYNDFKLKGERIVVPRSTFPFFGDISIYSSRVALTTLRGKIISVIIENQEIADTLRAVFELAWIGAQKYK